MNVDARFLARDTGARSTFLELQAVRILTPVLTDDGDTMPVGSEGTVVGIYEDGAAYAVEFSEPVGALATLAVESLEPVPDHR